MRNIKRYTVGVIIAMTMIGSACTDNKEVQVITWEDGSGNNAGNISYGGMLSDPVVCDQKNAYDTLNVATYITRIGSTYFIADCYHDQIIYHDNIEDPLNQWDVLTDEVHYAHTIASDGILFVVDDTENNRLMVFQKTEEGYAHTQTLENIGMRPHYVQYDERNQIFMAWSSITGEMYLIKRAEQPGQNGVYSLYVDKILKIDELYGVYVRSFTVMEDGIYFVSGHNNQKIIKAAVNDVGDGFDIIAEYRVPGRIAGMVQITKMENYYYITVSTDDQENQDAATIIRTDSLERLSDGLYEDVYDQFGLAGGTPYYITEIGEKYYMAHHRTSENIIAFDVKEDHIQDIEIIY